MRSARLPALVLSLLVIACAPSTDQRPVARPSASASVRLPSPSPSPGPRVFDTEEAMHHIRTLVGAGPRPKGSREEAAAADHIARVFHELGFEVIRQDVSLASGGRSQNVIGRRRAGPPGHVVVGAHYDTVGVSPGANDNASGVAVVLALAKALKDAPISIDLVAFTAEERDPVTRKHHEGSLAFVAAMPEPPQAMVSVDMVGHGTPLMVTEDRRHRTELAAEIEAIAAQLGVPVSRRVEGDVSDHTSFSRAGVPAVLLWTPRHPSFHQASDTLEVVQPDAVERAGKVVLAWLDRRLETR